MGYAVKLSSGSKKAEFVCTYIGSYSANTSIDVSAYLKPGDTVNNFWAQVNYIGITAAAKGTITYQVSNGIGFGRSLSGTILSISNNTVSCRYSFSGGANFVKGTASVNYYVYYVGVA